MFAEEKKNGERKRGKYLERENIFFCGGEEKQRKKRRTIFGEGKYVLAPLATGTLPKGILDFGTPAQETLASGVLAVGTLAFGTLAAEKLAIGILAFATLAPKTLATGTLTIEGKYFEEG